jgi:peptide/nickel transport system ATP-binding protein
MTGTPVAARRLLDVRELYVSFRVSGETVTAVRSFDCSVDRGEVVALVGESGSGKSTVALAVMQLLPPNASATGSILLDGRELIGLSDRELSMLRGRRMAMISQDPFSALTPVYTVGAQIAEAIHIHAAGITGAAARDRAVELLDIVGIPNARQRAGAFPHELSGGMRQRAVIAMALANEPELLIADEPTTALDVTVQAEILELLSRATAATRAGLLLITHDLGIVAGIADRVTVMSGGSAVETGTTVDVFARPRVSYTRTLLRSIQQFDVRSSAGHAAATTDVVPAVSRAQNIEGPRAARRTMLEVRQLVVEFPVRRGIGLRSHASAIRAVDEVTFDVREGETLALVGESGAGKTTTAMEVLSLRRPAAGSVIVMGRDTATMTRRDRYETRRELQVVFQDPMGSLDPRMTVHDILSEPMHAFGIAVVERALRVDELLSVVGLSPADAGSYPHVFSGGQRQRIAIARALALKPKLVILDEPVSSLDASVQADIVALLNRLQSELNLAYLFIAHDLGLVRRVADRVAVLYGGRIVEIGTVEEVFERPAHPYTEALLSATPVPDPLRERQRRRVVLRADTRVGNVHLIGCPFRERCHRFELRVSGFDRHACEHERPALRVVVEGADHEVACHYGKAEADATNA